MPITGTFGTAGTDTAIPNTCTPVTGPRSGSPPPVIVYFGVEPVDKAAVATHVTLTSTPAVDGAWARVRHDDGRWGLDYRTKDYWPAGTRSTSPPSCTGSNWRPAGPPRGHPNRRQSP